MNNINIVESYLNNKAMDEEEAQESEVFTMEVSETTNQCEDFNSDDSVLDPDFSLPLNECAIDPDEMSIESHSVQPTTQRICNTKKEIKNKRNKGEGHVTRKGIVVRAKKLVPLSRNCRKKCKDSISITTQKELFDNYWALGSYNQRVLFIGRLVEIEDKTSSRLNKPKIRDRQYHLRYYIKSDSKTISVCKKCFQQCFDETDGFIKTVVKKKLQLPYLQFSDHRGLSTPPNKLPSTQLNLIREHILSFPTYESHYSRRDTSCKYLQSDLTLSLMYRLYCEQSEEGTVSLKTYSDVFKTMNIKFKKPKVDTCSKCDEFKSQIDIAKKVNPIEAENLTKQRDDHHLKADLAYEAKEHDKKMSKTDVTVKTYSFDLQPCLPTPLLQTSISFYKRQLWTFNLTVHDGENNKPYCFMWHEALAKRGGNEIASCLLKHLQLLEQENKQVKTVIFYSDSCVGQNKNSYLSTMFMTFLQNSNTIETIDHKFLVVGHTHMECDVDHALIERKKKKTNVKIHHPHDWYNFVRSVGVRKKFTVVEMKSDDFKNFSIYSSTKFLWRKRDSNSENFTWKDAKWLRYTKSDFGKIQFKNSLDQNDDFKVLNVSKRGISTGQLNDIHNLPTDIRIPVKKKNDLIALLPFIDPCFHSFYKNLATDEMPDIDPDFIDDKVNIND